MTDVQSPPTPIDVWLARQQDLSAVERFAEAHATGLGVARYRDRLPATPPGPGQQYGFEVDLDACTGCKACVAACHGLNGLAEGETWRRVGALHAGAAGLGGSAGGGGDDRGSVTVTSACHHCVEPACLEGCPAQAYEKDPVTGIVRHLDDACIGCSYCTLTCPYEVPTFRPDLGIVRKCDMCADRLAEGEAPACVQGCPQGAITIALVDVADLLAETRPSSFVRNHAEEGDFRTNPVEAPSGFVRKLVTGANFRTNPVEAPSSFVRKPVTGANFRTKPDGVGEEPVRLVPSAPVSGLTVPTTRYRTATPVPGSWVATDRSSVHPSPGHAPLALMLVLTQVAVGMTVASGWIARSPSVGHAGADALGLAGLATGLVALAASTLHLGRPLLAWRAVLGLRRSWLSREIVAFGAFAAGGAGRFAAAVLGAPAWVETTAGAVGVAGGVAGVWCSALLYAVTGRRWWRLPVTLARFGGTALLGGAVGSAAVLTLADPDAARRLVPALVLAAGIGLALSVLAPLVPLARPVRQGDADLAATARLLTHDLRDRHLLRLAAAGTTALLLGGAALAPGETGIVLVVAGLVLLVGEHQDRRLFFLASVAPRMPGSPR